MGTATFMSCPETSWALDPDPDTALPGAAGSTVVGQEQGGRGQAPGVLGGGGASSEEQKQTLPRRHPPEPRFLVPEQTPLPHEISLTKHKFKQITEDFKTAKSQH